MFYILLFIIALQVTQHVLLLRVLQETSGEINEVNEVNDKIKVRYAVNA